MRREPRAVGTTFSPHLFRFSFAEPKFLLPNLKMATNGNKLPYKVGEYRVLEAECAAGRAESWPAKYRCWARFCPLPCVALARMRADRVCRGRNSPCFALLFML